MPELTKVEHLLKGLTPYVLERMYSKVPDEITDTKEFMAFATKLEQARKVASQQATTN